MPVTLNTAEKNYIFSRNIREKSMLLNTVCRNGLSLGIMNTGIIQKTGMM